MSCKEVDRLGMVRAAVDQHLGRGATARQLGLSGCRIRRLMSRQRGRQPPDAIPDEMRSA